MKTIAEKVEEKDKNIILPFSVLPGGKDDSGNWLRNLEPKTVFLTKIKSQEQSNFALVELHVVAHKGACTLLLNNLEEPENFRWVETALFSKIMKLVEVLKDGKEISNE